MKHNHGLAISWQFQILVFSIGVPFLFDIFPACQLLIMSRISTTIITTTITIVIITSAFCVAARENIG